METCSVGSPLPLTSRHLSFLHPPPPTPAPHPAPYRPVTERASTAAMALSCITALHGVSEEVTAVLLEVEAHLEFWQVGRSVMIIPLPHEVTSVRYPPRPDTLYIASSV
jgi:hypothetical protein